MGIGAAHHGTDSIMPLLRDIQGNERQTTYYNVACNMPRNVPCNTPIVPLQRRDGRRVHCVILTREEPDSLAGAYALLTSS